MKIITIIFLLFFYFKFNLSLYFVKIRFIPKIHLKEFSGFPPIQCFHSRGQHLSKFIGTKESVCIRKEFNSNRLGLGHKHGRRFIVLGHKYGCMTSCENTQLYRTILCLSGKTTLSFWLLSWSDYRESPAFRRTMIDFPELIAVNYILTSRSEDRVAL